MPETLGRVMKINRSGFQACDVRGTYGDTPEAQISPMHAYLIGQALSEQVPEGETLLLAGDGRVSTPGLMAMLEAGFARPCLNLGAQIPTPLAYFAKHRFHAHSSVVVTASHNAAGCNGFKIQVGNLPAQPEWLSQLRETVGQRHAEGVTLPIPTCPMVEDTARRDRAWADYQQAMSGAFPPVQGRRLALDCMHGCYSVRARVALAEMGYEVTALRDSLAGDFNGGIPDPADPENLADLSTLVSRNHAAFGVALDGDGDRARFLDDKGRPIDNGTVLVLLYRYLRETRPESGNRKVVCDQKTRLAVVQALREAGAEPLLEKSGHTFIRSRILRENALLGGENSGHFFWGSQTPYPVPAGDCGLFAALAVGDMLRHWGRPLSELARTVPESPYYTGDIRGLRYAGDRSQLLARLAAGIDGHRYKVVLEDGLRVETADAFAQIRPSVTEPDMLTAVFDAREAQGLARLVALIAGLFPSELSGLAEKIRASATRVLTGAAKKESFPCTSCRNL